MAGARARLEVLTGKAAGMSIVLDDELVIGRLAEGAGRLADDEEISRSHARLSLDAQGLCAVEDLGSTNGTWVNGMRIATPQALSEGDTLELGATTMVVREISRPEAPPAPADGPPAPAEGPPAPLGRSATSESVAVPPAAPSPSVEAPPPPPVPVPAAEASETETDDLPTERVPAGPGPASPAPAPPAPAPPTFPPAAPAAAAASEGAPPEAAARLPSTLSVKLDIDFDGPEVQIRLDEATEPVRLVFDGESWHPAPSLATEKGNPA